MGGISGQNYGSIINCFNSGAIIGGDSSTGGIAGILSSNCSIINCVNTGNVTGKHDNTAGIAGSIQSGSAVKNCVNTGDITAATPTNQYNLAKYVGGIVGGCSASVSNCVSTGNVTASSFIDEKTSTEYKPSYIGGVVGELTGTTENCSWFKDSAISPAHGIGGAGSYDAGSDEGTTSLDKKEKLPVSAILLDSYVKTGHTFELTATAYPAESEQAAALAVTAAEGLKLTPAELKSGEKTTFTVTEGTAGTEYKAEVSAGDASAAFTVIPADAPVTPTPEPDPTPSGSSSSGGCSTGFGALALLALLPLALRRRG